MINAIQNYFTYIKPLNKKQPNMVTADDNNLLDILETTLHVSSKAYQAFVRQKRAHELFQWMETKQNDERLIIEFDPELFVNLCVYFNDNSAALRDYFQYVEFGHSIELIDDDTMNKNGCTDILQKRYIIDMFLELLKYQMDVKKWTYHTKYESDSSDTYLYSDTVGWSVLWTKVLDRDPKYLKLVPPRVRAQFRLDESIHTNQPISTDVLEKEFYLSGFGPPLDLLSYFDPMRKYRSKSYLFEGLALPVRYNQCVKVYDEPSRDMDIVCCWVFGAYDLFNHRVSQVNLGKVVSDEPILSTRIRINETIIRCNARKRLRGSHGQVSLLSTTLFGKLL